MTKHSINTQVKFYSSFTHKIAHSDNYNANVAIIEFHSDAAKAELARLVEEDQALSWIRIDEFIEKLYPEYDNFESHDGFEVDHANNLIVFAGSEALQHAFQSKYEAQPCELTLNLIPILKEIPHEYQTTNHQAT